MKFEKVTTFALALSLGAFCIDFASPLRASAKCNRFDITCNPHIKPITQDRGLNKVEDFEGLT